MQKKEKEKKKDCKIETATELHPDGHFQTTEANVGTGISLRHSGQKQTFHLVSSGVQWLHDRLTDPAAQ